MAARTKGPRVTRRQVTTIPYVILFPGTHYTVHRAGGIIYNCSDNDASSRTDCAWHDGTNRCFGCARMETELARVVCMVAVDPSCSHILTLGWDERAIVCFRRTDSSERRQDVSTRRIDSCERRRALRARTSVKRKAAGSVRVLGQRKRIKGKTRRLKRVGVRSRHRHTTPF
ncbi:hypothetical protein BRADI_5g20326v3 [Brachypodium distachyon]|uniref:Uncharacterized protein n=1 Tax=Brachypodium distachyon TaxID=15368 RepID=A0A2K2CI97_BRADI|nr:hypothetical protein BRADI_5g20326v3 [Brachypodium distachyon]